jgi:hypothetical protein
VRSEVGKEAGRSEVGKEAGTKPSLLVRVR